jgi:hypothetical protein
MGRLPMARPKPRIRTGERRRQHSTGSRDRRTCMPSTSNAASCRPAFRPARGRPHAAQSFQSRQGTVPSGTKPIIPSAPPHVKRRGGVLFHKSLTPYQHISASLLTRRGFLVARGIDGKSPACPEPSFCCP